MPSPPQPGLRPQTLNFLKCDKLGWSAKSLLTCTSQLVPSNTFGIDHHRLGCQAHFQLLWTEGASLQRRQAINVYKLLPSSILCYLVMPFVLDQRNSHDSEVRGKRIAIGSVEHPAPKKLHMEYGRGVERTGEGNTVEKMLKTEETKKLEDFKPEDAHPHEDPTNKREDLKIVKPEDAHLHDTNKLEDFKIFKPKDAHLHDNKPEDFKPEEALHGGETDFKPEEALQGGEIAKKPEDFKLEQPLHAEEALHGGEKANKPDHEDFKPEEALHGGEKANKPEDFKPEEALHGGETANKPEDFKPEEPERHSPETPEEVRKELALPLEGSSAAVAPSPPASTTPHVPMTISGSNQRNDPPMSEERRKALDSLLQAAKNEKKEEKKAAKAAKSKAKSRAKQAAKKKPTKREKEENPLDSEEDLSSGELPSPSPSPKREEADACF